MPAQWRVIICLMLCLPPAGLHATPLGGPSECDDVSAISAFTQFRYEQFQGIFETLVVPKDPFSACTSCHPNSSGAGTLGLGDGFSYGNLVNIPSAGGEPLLRVEPGAPNLSWLFLKINCNNPGFGSSRMPLGLPTLSLTQQRFFYDWIRLGAPLSRLGFEDR